MEHFLRISRHDGAVDHVALSGESLTIGRKAPNGLSFPADETLSRMHVRFSKADAGWVVQDLNTRNGTRVNGELVEGGRLLECGDIIHAGRLVIRFDSASEMTDTAAQPLIETQTTLDQALDCSVKESAGMHLLVRACRELVSPGPEGWYTFLLSSALKTLGADRGVLMLMENSELVTSAAIGPDVPISATIRDRVLKERLSLVAPDVEEDEELQDAQSLIFQGVRSVIAVPLQTEERVHGLLYLHTKRPRRFGAEDLNLVTVLAHMAATRREQEMMAESERAQREEKLRLERIADNRRLALEAAEMLRHAETRAVMAETAASVGRLAAAVSHEINSPLGALKSSVETLLRTVEKCRSANDPARFFAIAEDLCGSILSSAERLNAIAARLRRVTNLDRAEVQELDLVHLLGDVAQVVAAGDLSLFRLERTTIPAVISKPQTLSAIFASILEYCRPEGAAITARHNGDTVLVSIEQPGLVLPEAELSELFDPSFRAVAGKIATENWGLFSARFLIREIGGDLYVDSTPERGTVLNVLVPYVRS
jgi:signal transduction histidine kinase